MGLLAILFVLGIAFLLSNDKKNINVKGIGIMLVLQFLVTWFMFSTKIGQQIINAISAVFNKLIEFGTIGIDIILGGIVKTEGESVFFFDVLLLIIFFATILSVLSSLKILLTVFKFIRVSISKVTGLSKVESFNAVNSVFFGQSEALLAMKFQFDHLNGNRFYIFSASAMWSVSVSIVGAYLQI